MARTSIPSRCPRCGARVSTSDAVCPACRLDLGAPNVREVDTDAERMALAKREARAQARARKRDCLGQYEELGNRLAGHSGVVVTMPATVAMVLFKTMSALYAGFESQVQAGVRRPPLPIDDRERASVAGTLFGSYAKEILYGVLSLNTWGLRTYGEVHCRLRDETIAHRVTFLETNSYHFVRRRKVIPGDPLPTGYRAVWSNRHLLALAKLQPHLGKEQDQKQWPTILVRSDGRDRTKDEFIEAHIYGSFNSESIRDVEIDVEQAPGDLRRLLARIIGARYHESQNPLLERSTP
jgi:hypothetical protein